MTASAGMDAAHGRREGAAAAARGKGAAGAPPALPGRWLWFAAGCALGGVLATVCGASGKLAAGQVAHWKDVWPFSVSAAFREHAGDEDVLVEERKKFLYVYEKNMKTGSTSWSAMLEDAAEGWHVLGCGKTSFVNALNADSYEVTDRDALMACHVRRMSLSRERPIRIISSFNLEKDMVVSAFMQQNNLTIAQVDKNSTLFLNWRNGFPRTWQIDYMGYSNFQDRAFRPFIVCPSPQEMKDAIRIAVDDTYLPISHALPCMSRVLLKKMVGLEIGDTHHLNVRGNGEPAEREPDLSCLDVEISKAMTAKMARLYDGTDLSGNYYWRQAAKRIERQCVEDETAYATIASTG